MQNQDLNTSILSAEEVPVGFRSFSQDNFAADQNEQMKGYNGPAEVSFAKDIELADPASLKPAEQMILG